MKRKLIPVILAVLLVLVTAMPAFATVSIGKTRLVDNAGLLSADEAGQLASKLDEISERQEFDVVVVTENGLGGKTPQDYADDFFDYNGYGFGENYDGALLLLDMEERAYHISTSGYGITALTDYGMDRMEESFVPKLAAGNYYDAFMDFANQCDYYVTRAKDGDPVDVPGSTAPEPAPVERKKNPVGTAGFAAVIGFIGSLLRTNRMKSKLKTVHRKASANEYVRDNSMQVRVAQDAFLYRNVTRTEKPRERDHSSGGSSTHISSSGHSHGGSGGHF